jgi:AcrR family transcriptional regulator
MRLFREQGYTATTVDQIAEAAEVSQSTFFRYFPTKEDVILKDDYDDRILAAFLEQPADLPPIQATRQAIRAVYAGLSPEEMAQERERHELISSTPELRPRMLDTLTEGIELLAQALAKRNGLDSEDLAVRTFAGALMGVSLSAMFAAGQTPGKDFMTLYDASLQLLEDGLPLKRASG